MTLSRYICISTSFYLFKNSFSFLNIAIPLREQLTIGGNFSFTANEAHKSIAFKRYLSDEKTKDLSIETIFSLFSFTFLRESVRKHRIRGSRRSFRAVSIESAGCRGRTDLFRSFAFTKGEGVASFAIAVSRG